MKIVRFHYKEKESYGVLREENLFFIRGSIFNEFGIEERSISISEAIILPPVSPTKIVCVGYNYKSHAGERNVEIPESPLIFIKPSTSVIGQNDSIILPKLSKRVDFEGELAVVIKKRAFCLSENDNPSDYILGYACFNDVTARDIQQKEQHNTKAKSFDTFAPLGPWIGTEVDPKNLTLKTFLNGKLKQSSKTKNMIFDPFYLVYYLSQIMTLLPGDVIATGTPAGSGPLSPGDRVEVQISEIGTLSNTVHKIY
ncbi:MAG: fumarylacetoacetate hydrolase family protein [Acidobacteriota bacterium]